MRPHGTQKKYILDRCRCEACREASAKAYRKYQRRRGIVANNENLRDYLDVAIGRWWCGAALMTGPEVAAELGISVALFRYRERAALRERPEGGFA